jgi:hypothetical protein
MLPVRGLPGRRRAATIVIGQLGLLIGGLPPEQLGQPGRRPPEGAFVLAVACLISGRPGRWRLVLLVISQRPFPFSSDR